MYCSACGAMVPEGSSFCSQCGSRQQSQAAPPGAPPAATAPPAQAAAPAWLPKALKSAAIGAVTAVVLGLLLTLVVHAITGALVDRVAESAIEETGVDVPGLSNSDIQDLYVGAFRELTPGVATQWVGAHGGAFRMAAEIEAEGQSGDVEFEGRAPLTLVTLIPLLALVVGMGVAHIVHKSRGLGVVLTRSAAVLLIYLLLLGGVGLVAGTHKVDLAEGITDLSEKVLGDDDAEEFVDEVLEVGGFDGTYEYSVSVPGAALNAILIGFLAMAIVTPLSSLVSQADPEWRRGNIARAGVAVKSSLWASVLCGVLAVVLFMAVGVVNTLREGIPEEEVDFSDFEEAPPGVMEATYFGMAYGAPGVLGFIDGLALGGTAQFAADTTGAVSSGDDFDETLSVFDVLDEYEEAFDLTALAILLAPILSGVFLAVVVAARGRFSSPGELWTWLGISAAVFLLLQLALLSASKVSFVMSTGGAFGRGKMEGVLGMDVGASFFPALILIVSGVAVGGAVAAGAAAAFRNTRQPVAAPAYTAAAPVQAPAAPAPLQAQAAPAPAYTPQEAAAPSAPAPGYAPQESPAPNVPEAPQENPPTS